MPEQQDPIEIMTKAALSWVAENIARDPQFSVAPRVMPGVVFTNNTDADEMNSVMVEAAEDAGFFVTEKQVNEATYQFVERRPKPANA